MYSLLILVVLALSVGVVRQVLHGLHGMLPIDIPVAFTTLVDVGLGIGVAYALHYSVFATFGIPVRSDTWAMVGTGFVLVALAGFLPKVLDTLGGMLRRV
jgi:hypothetical protein